MTFQDQGDIFNRDLYETNTGPKLDLGHGHMMAIKNRLDVEVEGHAFHIFHLSSWGWRETDRLSIRIKGVDNVYANIEYHNYMSLETAYPGQDAYFSTTFETYIWKDGKCLPGKQSQFRHPELQKHIDATIKDLIELALV